MILNYILYFLTIKSVASMVVQKMIFAVSFNRIVVVAMTTVTVAAIIVAVIVIVTTVV